MYLLEHFVLCQKVFAHYGSIFSVLQIQTFSVKTCEKYQWTSLYLQSVLKKWETVLPTSFSFFFLISDLDEVGALECFSNQQSPGPWAGKMEKTVLYISDVYMSDAWCPNQSKSMDSISQMSNFLCEDFDHIFIRCQTFYVEMVTKLSSLSSYYWLHLQKHKSKNAQK